MNSTAMANYLASHLWVILLAVLWTLPWKGVALWKAARNRSIAWFVAIFLINTLGILEIIYIFIFSKMKDPSANTTPDKSLNERKII
jgi:hypothetical protein